MTTEPESFRADFLEYHRSIAAELAAVKDRIRHLTPHRLTSGMFKEAALRSVLRRHLPESLLIGSGFIVNKQGVCSTQIDLLLVDATYPTLFKDGDLLVVTPDAVRGIIEVKTTLSGEQELRNCCAKVIDCWTVCAEAQNRDQIFTGVFVYDATSNQCRNIIEAAVQVFADTRCWIKAVSHGPDVIGVFSREGQLPDGQQLRNMFSAWDTPRLAPAYFISMMLSYFSRQEMMFNSSAWSPAQPENRLRFYNDPDSGEIAEFAYSENQDNE